MQITLHFNCLETEELCCIIHYHNKDSKYSKIKSVSEVNKSKIVAAKKARLQLHENNVHQEQCDTVPDEIDSTKHGVHLEPCYKKFTKILSNKKLPHIKLNRR